MVERGSISTTTDIKALGSRSMEAMVEEKKLKIEGLTTKTMDFRRYKSMIICIKKIIRASLRDEAGFDKSERLKIIGSTGPWCSQIDIGEERCLQCHQ